MPAGRRMKGHWVISQENSLCSVMGGNLHCTHMAQVVLDTLFHSQLNTSFFSPPTGKIPQTGGVKSMYYIEHSF